MPRHQSLRSELSYNRVLLALSMLCFDHSPYSEATDQEIADQLASIGYPMSAQTVRKYLRWMEDREEIVIFYDRLAKIRPRLIVFTECEDSLAYFALFAGHRQAVVMRASPRVLAMVDAAAADWPS